MAFQRKAFKAQGLLTFCFLHAVRLKTKTGGPKASRICIFPEKDFPQMTQEMPGVSMTLSKWLVISQTKSGRGPMTGSWRLEVHVSYD